MTFPFDININLTASGIKDVPSRNIRIHSGITTLVGPNGAGKTQLLRAIKVSPIDSLANKKIRYVSAGRLGPLENFRSNYDGRRGGADFESAQYGNKDSLTYRHQSETVLGDFATLAARPDILIKIQERLKRLFKRDVHVDWDGGKLKVFFNRIDQHSMRYSSSREASGLLHLVAILAALYDDEVGLVLIDEPEVSLHPQLQSFLLNEILSVAGNPAIHNKKLIVISTHSTEFIELRSVDDLASIVFCHDIHEPPTQINPLEPEFRNRKIQALLSRMGQEHKLALFSKRPLLVEGPSDQIMCSMIGRKLELNIEAAGSQILPVIGKGQMPIVLKLFRSIGKEPALMADADALVDGLDIVNSFTVLPAAQIKAESMGHRDANKFARDVCTDFSQLVSANWGEIEAVAISHPYWINRDLQKDEMIAKRRSAFCSIMKLDTTEFSQLPTQWQAIRNRLKTLLGLLESVGCFILTQGTIESYYRHASQLTADEKPNAAAHEAVSIFSSDQQIVRESYSDIIRALEFVAHTDKINEARAIRDMVLAMVTPALASLSEKTNALEINSMNQSLFGDKAKLFFFSIVPHEGDLALVVALVSGILNIAGFPLTIKRGTNPIEEVNRQLGIMPPL